MINRKNIIIVILCLFVGIGLGLWFRTRLGKPVATELLPEVKVEKTTSLPVPANSPDIPPEKKPGDFSRVQDSPAVISKPWEQNLKKTLHLQGGDALIDAQFTVVESFVWKKDGVLLNVESIIITLKNKNRSEVRFRALVDSHSGNIIETWDRPVVDPANTRAIPGIKLDPRYHSDN